MNKILVEKIKESIQAVLPLTVVVLIVLFLLKVPTAEILEFSLGAFMLIVGLVIFGLGANESMMFIAEEIGSYITKKRTIILLIIVGLAIGFLITISEPSLWVLGDQFNAVIPRLTLIFSISIGVAIFLVIALLRIVFQVRLNILLTVAFTLLFILAAFIPAEFIPVAFDSGGVTTGPMAVPFIISLGLGVVSTSTNGNTKEDSFGMVGIASIGPILTVFILGLIFKTGSVSSGEAEVTKNIFGYFIQYIGDMGIAILPFVLFFAIFQIFAFKLKKKRVLRILMGFFLTYIGLVIFLSGASVGFMSVGSFLGKTIAGFESGWWLILAGLVFGFVIVSAEPSVVVLVYQVEEVTDGRVPKKVMMPAMAIGVSIAIGLAMLRIVFDISIWYILLPGYIIALVLTFIVPKMFTAIAFDSGGAVSGALTSTFLVPFALGAASVIYENHADTQSMVLKNAFGLVAFVALAPLVTIQVLGLIFKVKSDRKNKHEVRDTSEDEIIELEEV
ncbi:MAG: DUF1538 domain-containing protein [Bacilli bacterium]|nr:DUF1538 domain-containing protein [Bacilli bacterium]